MFGGLNSNFWGASVHGAGVQGSIQAIADVYMALVNTKGDILGALPAKDGNRAGPLHEGRHFPQLSPFAARHR